MDLASNATFIFDKTSMLLLEIHLCWQMKRGEAKLYVRHVNYGNLDVAPHDMGNS